MIKGNDLTQKTILDFLKTHKRQLELEYGLTKIGLFGSYAKNTFDQERDIDIVIEATKHDFFMREDLKEYLEDVFDTRVDIGYIGTIRQFYRQKIDKDILYV